MILWGILEDSTYLFAAAKYISYLNPFFKNYGYPFGTSLGFSNYSEPLIYFLFFSLSKIIDAIVVYNVLILLTFLLNILVSRKFFTYFLIGETKISTLLAIIFSFSPYFWYQSRSHLPLMQVWSLLLFILLLLKAKKISDYAILGLFLCLVTLISNYLGFFGLIFSIIYFLLQGSDQILKRITSRVNIFKTNNDVANTKRLLINNVIFVSFYILFTYLFLNQFITSNYTNRIDEKTINRPVQDALIFSSKPWYYVLPPEDNPFFGVVTRKTLNYLNEASSNMVFDNYFKSEHSASFLGISNLVLAILCLAAFIKRDRDFLKQHGFLLIVVVLLFVLSMPPFVQIGYTKIFLPSYFLWKYFPMFRVTSRLGILILPLVLVFSGKFLVYIKHYNNLLSKLFLVFISILCFAEFYIPIKLTYISESPEVFTYIKKNTPVNSPIAVYPYSKLNYSLFWMREFDRPLVNPRDFKYDKYDFNSEEFTKALTTCEGIMKAKELGANYIVIFDENQNDTTKFKENLLLKELAFFKGVNSSTLPLIEPFLIINNASANYPAFIFEITEQAQGGC